MRSRESVVRAGPTDADLVPVELRVDDDDPRIVNVVRTGNITFLPVAELCQILGTSYRERAEYGELTLGRTQLRIGPNDSVRRVDDVLYIESAVFATLTHTTVRVDWSELSVLLANDTLFPAARRRARIRHVQRVHGGVAMPDDWDDDHPLPATRAAVFDLGYGVIRSSESKTHQFFVALETTFWGGTFSTRFTRDQRHPEIQWVFTSDGNPWLRHVILGTLAPFGSWAHDLQGFTLSNAPVRYGATYDTIVVHGVAPAGWDVDIERNGEIIAGDSVTASGRYAFRIPVAYGTNPYTIAMYGPDDEMRRTPVFIAVPNELIPPHQLYYAVNAGHCADHACRFGADVHLRVAPIRRLTFVGAFSTYAMNALVNQPFITPVDSSMALVSADHPATHSPWRSVSAVAQITSALSVVANRAAEATDASFSDASTGWQTALRYLPSEATMVQLNRRASTTTAAAAWNGTHGTIRSGIAFTGTHRSNNRVFDMPRATALLRGYVNGVAAFLRYQRPTIAGMSSVMTRSWTGGGDLSFHVVPRGAIRIHVDGIGTSRDWTVATRASVPVLHANRLDVQARWRSGHRRPMTTWSLGKTVSFASLHGSVASAPGVPTSTVQSLDGGMRLDPWERRVTLSPYARVTHAPLVTTLR